MLPLVLVALIRWTGGCTHSLTSRQTHTHIDTDSHLDTHTHTHLPNLDRRQTQTVPRDGEQGQLIPEQGHQPTEINSDADSALTSSLRVAQVHWVNHS